MTPLVQTKLRLAQEEKTWTDRLLQLGEEDLEFLECEWRGTKMVESRLGTRQREARAVWRDLLEGGLAD